MICFYLWELYHYACYFELKCSERVSFAKNEDLYIFFVYRTLDQTVKPKIIQIIFFTIVKNKIIVIFLLSSIFNFDHYLILETS